MENKINSLVAALTGGDDERAEIAARAVPELARRKPGEVLQTICVLLVSEDVDRRWWGVRTLAEIPDNAVLQYLRMALKDRDGSVRQCAALALRKRPHTEAVGALIEALFDDDALVVELAADDLAEIGEGAVPALLRLLENGNPRAMLEVVRSLSVVGDRRSIPALFSLLDHDSQLVAYWANEGLERMGVGMVYYLPK